MEVASQPQPLTSRWSNMKEDNCQQGEGPLYYSLFKVLKFEPNQPLQGSLPYEVDWIGRSSWLGFPHMGSITVQCSATAFLDVTTSGELGLPAKQSVPFGGFVSDTSASAIWKINPSGLGHRLEAGWYQRWYGSRHLSLPPQNINREKTGRACRNRLESVLTGKTVGERDLFSRP